MANVRRMKLIVGWAALLAVAALFLCPLVLIPVGPTSNLYPAGSLERLSSPYPGGKVFVRNPELAEELEILRASGVFEIVAAEEAEKVVQLHPQEQAAFCGNPLLLTWATGGLVPAKVSDSWTFSFALEENGKVSEQQFVLQGERRISAVQHLFKPFRSDARTWGAILASEYERRR